jgi:hypothetical protein
VFRRVTVILILDISVGTETRLGAPRPGIWGFDS